MKKMRLDLFLLEKKQASTRTKAQELIVAGKVSLNGQVCVRPGEKVDEDAVVELLAKEHAYVSRGGLKLEAALEAFGWQVAGERVLDVGQSTGGFTDCLLQKGARQVVGIEVGQGQLAHSLRQDPRVVCWEKQDIRALSLETLGAKFSFCVVDLSFISLELVMPVLPSFLEPGAQVIVLVKPQFEVGKENVGSGGIVRDAALREEAKRKVEEVCCRVGFTVAGAIPSPIEGGDGNREFLLHLRWPSSKNQF